MVFFFKWRIWYFKNYIASEYADQDQNNFKAHENVLTIIVLKETFQDNLPVQIPPCPLLHLHSSQTSWRRFQNFSEELQVERKERIGGKEKKERGRKKVFRRHWLKIKTHLFKKNRWLDTKYYQVTECHSIYLD